MNRIFAKSLITVFGAGLIAGGLIAIFVYSKIVLGAFIFIFAGIQLLRRKTFGVYTVLFLSVVFLAFGLFFAAIALNDILHHMNNTLMLLMGLVPVFLSSLTIYGFTRPAVAEEFGLEKIQLIEKIDKQQIVLAAKAVMWIAVIVGGVIGGCYLIARFMSRG